VSSLHEDPCGKVVGIGASSLQAPVFGAQGRGRTSSLWQVLGGAGVELMSVVNATIDPSQQESRTEPDHENSCDQSAPQTAEACTTSVSQAR
jgi:hypothetical protein